MLHRTANFIITSSVMGCLAIVAVALRLWAGTVRRMRSGAEDILIIIGLVRRFFIRQTTAPADHRKILALGLCICNIVEAALFEPGYSLDPGIPNVQVTSGPKVSYNLRLCSSSTIKARGGR